MAEPRLKPTGKRAGSRAVAAVCVAAAGWLAMPATPAAADLPALHEALTDQPGNPARGRQIVRDQGAASCLICHGMPITEEPDHGNVGPPLHGVGSRYSVAELRQRLVDPRSYNPETIMPSYYRTDGLYRVLGRFDGRPIYTAQQIEDVVAYLAGLREPAP